MRITSVTIETFRWPLVTPITNGTQTYTHVSKCLVTIETDEGITGVGVGEGHAITHAAIEHFIPLLLGRDPFDVERIWHDLWIPKLVGRRGMSTRAISIIDVALWDIRSKRADVPLYKLLGAARTSVTTYVAGGYYQPGKGLKELAAEMEENVLMGARAVKMKVGAASLTDDIERVRVVRETIGPDVKLMVDANCAYRLDEAKQFAQRVEPLNPFWFEEPIAVDDYDGYQRLSSATSVPIAAGENEYTRYGFRDLVQHRGAAILNPDATLCGGITEYLKISSLASAFEVPLAPHGPQEIHVHLVAGLENSLILEYYRETVDPLWGTLFSNHLPLNADGTVTVPDAPGIGIEPNYTALGTHLVARAFAEL